MLGCLVLGLKANTLKKECERPRIEPLSKLNVDSQVVGVLSSSCMIRGLRGAQPVRCSMVEMIVCLAEEMIVSQSCSGSSPAPELACVVPVLEFIKCPTGTSTTSASFPSGAAV